MPKQVFKNMLFQLFLGAAGMFLLFTFVFDLSEKGNEDINDYTCIQGAIYLTYEAALMPIGGEAIICGQDWIISNIYFPSIKEYTGEIQFRPFNIQKNNKNIDK